MEAEPSGPLLKAICQCPRNVKFAVVNILYVFYFILVTQAAMIVWNL
jgi:hypothetical protein